MDVASIDLNLLVVFDALMAERSVTGAGNRLGRSQSATSTALSRLRLMVGDPLFVRVAGGVAPTPRAEGLVGPVREALAQLDLALSAGRIFEPATAERIFRLAASASASEALIPGLVARLRSAAPAVRLMVIAHEGHGAPRDLGHGLDLAVGYYRNLPGDLRRQTLATDRLACLTRKPLRADLLRLAGYLDRDHVVVTGPGCDRGVVSDLLLRAGNGRRVAVTLSAWGTAAELVAQTDLVLTAPLTIAEGLAARFDLALIPVPKELGAPLPLEAIWHERQHRDGACVWLRSLLGDGISGIERSD